MSKELFFEERQKESTMFCRSFFEGLNPTPPVDVRDILKKQTKITNISNLPCNSGRFEFYSFIYGIYKGKNYLVMYYKSNIDNRPTVEIMQYSDCTEDLKLLLIDLCTQKQIRLKWTS